MKAYYPKIDGVQNRAIRFFCGAPRTAPLLSLTGDISWVPSVVRRDVETLRFYNQITEMSNDRLTHALMEWDHSIGGEWSQNLKTLMESLNLTDKWELRERVNIDSSFIELYNMYKETWKSQLDAKPKTPHLLQD